MGTNIYWSHLNSMKSSILKKHRNQLPKFLEDRGFTSSDFEIQETEFSIELKYKSSPMKFKFIRSKDSFVAYTYEFTRFAANFQTKSYASKYISFEEILVSLDGWIKNHLKEYISDLQEVDYLSQWIYSSNSVEIEQIDFDSVEPFKTDEIQQIKIGLDEVKYLVSKNLDLTETEISIVNKRIEYLADSLERTSCKTDWKNIAISTLINLITTLSLNPEQASTLWAMFHKIVESIPKLMGPIVKDLL